MRVIATLIAALALATSGCGKEEKKDSASETAPEEATPAGEPGDGNTEDANPEGDDPDKDEALLQELETAPVKACHESGFVFERRKLGCSTEWKLATSFECNRAGIREAFAATGYQIDAVLDAALGPEGYEDDGDGYSIDQCGETDGGGLVVHFVKRDTEDGKIRVREAESYL